MKQNEFILKVENLTQKMIEDQPYLVEDYTISITAWDIEEYIMIDQHITGLYPQLEEELEIEELCEGQMVYGGEEKVDYIKEFLTDMGFVISGSKNHEILKKGGTVKTVIDPNQEYLGEQDL